MYMPSIFLSPVDENGLAMHFSLEGKSLKSQRRESCERFHASLVPKSSSPHDPVVVQLVDKSRQYVVVTSVTRARFSLLHALNSIVILCLSRWDIAIGKVGDERSEQ